MAAAGEKSSAVETLELGGLGFFMVIGILMILTGIIAMLALLFKGPKKTVTPPAAGQAAPQTTTPPMATAPTGMSEEHFRVVIAAAVHVALKSQPKTLRLGYADSSWSFEGRRNIFQSRAMNTPRVAFRSNR
jgi:Na+-transporting methylmalonyl-CoA/oxaloacetate decarboxylase gamma subunit